MVKLTYEYYDLCIPICKSRCGWGGVEKKGCTFARFQKISDSGKISKLEKIRTEMYRK